MLVVDRGGVIQDVAGDIRRILDRGGATLRGSTLETLLDPVSATRLNSAMDEIFTSTTPLSVAFSGLRAKGADGSLIPVEAVLTVLEADGEARSSLLVTLRANRQGSASQRPVEEQSRGRLESSNRDLEAFASVAAHDLQEPLRKIRAFSDRVAHSAASGDTEMILGYLDRIDHAAARMQTLIDDLLNLARINGQEPQAVRVNLTDLVRDIVGELSSGGDDDTRVEVSETLPEVNADPVRMRQLFENLIGNALKFRKKETPIRVQISGERIGDWVQIRVSDNGIGFDDRYLEKIFQPFERLHGRAEYEGSGVGLALCRAIAERHRGTLDGHGEPGKGATFQVVLPAAEAK